MLKNTFCHIPGISPATEQRLWSAGIDCWEAALKAERTTLPRRATAELSEHILPHWRTWRATTRSPSPPR